MGRDESFKKWPAAPLSSERLKLHELRRKMEADIGKPFTVPLPRTGTVYLLVDCSSSMGEAKLKQAREGAVGFTREAHRSGYDVGLISFDSQARVVLEPASELAAYGSAVNRLIARGSTNMTEAIQLAVGQMQERFKERIICIVTDGRPDDAETTVQAGRDAKTAGIDIMTIGVEGADEALLRRLSTRDSLSIMVPNQQLERGIVSMVKLLPRKTQ